MLAANTCETCWMSHSPVLLMGWRMSICCSYLLLVNFHWQACLIDVYVVVIWMDRSVIPYGRHTDFKGQKLLFNFLCEFSLQSSKSSNWMFGKAKIKVLYITLFGLLKFLFIIKSFIYCHFTRNSVYNYECWVKPYLMHAWEKSVLPEVLGIPSELQPAKGLGPVQ